MSYFIGYFISKISLRTLNCLYTCKTTVFIIRPKHPQSSYKVQVTQAANICIPGTSNWNRVSGEVQRIKDMFAFRRRLKTSLFQQQDQISQLLFLKYFTCVMTSYIHCLRSNIHISGHFFSIMALYAFIMEVKKYSL